MLTQGNLPFQQNPFQQNPFVNNLTQQNKYIQQISIKYNIDKKSVLIKYLNHIIRRQINITSSFLEHSQVIVHSDKTDLNNTIDYFCENFIDSYT